MPLPKLTPEQREDALRRAMAARTHRAEILAQLKAGDLTLQDVFDLAEDDQVIASTKIVSVLRALPRVGTARAAYLMENVAIPQTRRVRGVGHRQRAELVMFTS